jgi:hypothetical protein
MGPTVEQTVRKKRKPRASTGRVGVILVADELRARGFDVLLPDGHKGCDILVRRSGCPKPTPVRIIRTVYFPPWYVHVDKFVGDLSDAVTVCVLLGSDAHYVRFFLARNRDLATHIRRRPGWKDYGFIDLEEVQAHENNWSMLTR